MAARLAHNQEVEGSSPSPVTNQLTARDRIRAAAERLGTFRPMDMQAELPDVMDTTVRKAILWFVDKGVMEKVGPGEYRLIRRPPIAVNHMGLPRRNAMKVAEREAIEKHIAETGGARPRIKAGI